jgi:ferredoxin
MPAEIYYFSGTGNSLVVARDIAAKTNAALIPIPSVMDREKISSDADTIGIVFPVYHAIFDGMPLIIERFTKKLDNLKSKYIFAVCTCKGWSRKTISKLGEIISSRGGKLSAGFVVLMPDNSSPSAVEERQTRLDNWKKKLGGIPEYVIAKKTGRNETNLIFNAIMSPFGRKLQKLTMELLEKSSGRSGLGFEELMHAGDGSYRVDESCNGCGICAKVCPVRDIEMKDKKPVWRNRCETCLACLNWCPKNAIHGGLAETDGVRTRYHHPEVKAVEMVRGD